MLKLIINKVRSVTIVVFLLWATNVFSDAVIQQPLFSKSETLIQPEKNSEPHFFFPGQQEEAEKKLRDLERRFGKKPNIIIFLADDIGWGDIGVYGGGVAIGAATPNLNKLANEGLKLTSVYAQPTCSPTRGTVMTGRLPVRHGILSPPQIGDSVAGLMNEQTLPEMLSEVGYHTAMMGKWHLGDGLKQQPQFNGFDEYYGILGSVKNYTQWRDQQLNPTLVHNNRVVKQMENNNKFIKSLIRAKRNQDYEEVYELNIETIAELDLDLKDQSLNFIKKMENSDKPWFLYHAFGKPHFDSYPSRKFSGASAAKGVYQDAIVEIDYIVGEIIEALEQTGQAENTLVFFTSDNGPSEDSWPDGGHTPFRGAKGSTWEGGVRVPGIAWWPGMINPGRISDGLFDLSDIFMTARNLASATLPKNSYIDGVDQTSFLLAEQGESNRAAVFYYMGKHFSAYRVGPFKFSRFLAQQTNSGAISGYVNDSTLQQVTLAHAVNLYTDPKERMPLLSKIAVIKSYVDGYKKRHEKSLEDYPPSEEAFSW